MFSWLINDMEKERLRAENAELRKELTEIRQEEFRKALLSPYQQQHFQNALGLSSGQL
ncbi:hypothetical protein LCGC14_1329800 [marine sediment metagenome]|uniref:Uncharacterized protein n=1 Tax=marine sediment metagenome TaxID=412755 RepID=A0A0F9L2V8_9ZZZZ